MSSAFVFGMMFGTIGLLTVQHYGLGDASFVKFFYVPAIPRGHRSSIVPTGLGVQNPVTAAVTPTLLRQGAVRQLPPPIMKVFPASAKEVAKALSLSLRRALQQEPQRLAVVVPAVNFGLFSRAPSKQVLGDPYQQLTEEMIDRADRELAYLIVKMLSDVAQQSEFACVFPSKQAAMEAEEEWEGGKFQPRVLWKLAKVMKSSAAGFGASASSTPRPKVLIVVSPGKKERAELARISKELGNDGIILLINPEAQLPPGFVEAFVLKENPHPDWAGGLLYHTWGSEWLLGVASPNGKPTVQGRLPTKPTLEDIDRGFGVLENDEDKKVALERRTAKPQS